MTDGQLLYLVFVAFYVLDGLLRLPRHAWIFVRRGGKQNWRLVRPMEVASRVGEGFGLLPLLGTFLPSGEGWWFSGEKDSIHWVDSPEGSSRIARIKNRAKLWRERCCIVGPKDTGTLTFPSQTASKRTLRWLKSDSFDRDSRLEASLSLPRAKAVLKKCRLIDRSFNFWVALLGSYVFVILPLAFSHYHSTRPRFALILVIFYLTFVIAIQWWVLVKRFSTEPVKGRWYKIIPLIFLPYHTMRMPRLLQMELSAGVHPLAMGKAVLEPEAFADFASDFMRRLRYPLNRLASEEAWRARYETCAQFLIETARLPEERWTNASPDRNSDGESFCPRCLKQYVEKETNCNTCNDLPTRSFEQ